MTPPAFCLAAPATPPRATQGPFAAAELRRLRATYEPWARGVFQRDLIGRLPPTERRALDPVTLLMPDELPAAQGIDPGCVLNVAAAPAERQVWLPLRSLAFLDQYCGVVAALERRVAPSRTVLLHLYEMLLAQPPENGPPPAPLAAFGLDDGIYADAWVKDVSNKLLNSMVLFVLAHELGHIRHAHAAPAPAAWLQQQEREADAYALATLGRVGVMPLGLTLFFTMAAVMVGQAVTHPLSSSRIEAIAAGIEHDPLAFVDRTEADPWSWVPRLRALAAEVRGAIPLLDDPASRGGLQRMAAGLDWARFVALARTG